MIKYPHIERLGRDEVGEITVGLCYVFPKIDGTQASVWSEGGELKAASRNRDLMLHDDNAGFYAYVLNSDLTNKLKTLFETHPSWVLYAEWLVPHSLKTYRTSAWRNMYVFDVFDCSSGTFIPYLEYSPVLDDHGIFYIPVLEIVSNPTEEHLLKLLERNTYLIDDGNGVGEGIVIKRYDFVNRYGRTTWAKLVRNEFREQNAATFKTRTVEMYSLEQKIAEEYITSGRVHKIVAKMEENGPVSKIRIRELLGRVWHDLIVDETWNIIQAYKSPTINFKNLNIWVISITKTLLPELFSNDTPKQETVNE